VCVPGKASSEEKRKGKTKGRCHPPLHTVHKRGGVH
jgi:hypothetical protein